MNPKNLVNHYKAKQAEPTFLTKEEEEELRAEEAWGPRLVLVALALFVIGFAVVFCYVAFFYPR